MQVNVHIHTYTHLQLSLTRHLVPGHDLKQVDFRTATALVGVQAIAWSAFARANQLLVAGVQVL